MTLLTSPHSAPSAAIVDCLAAQRTFFATGKTKDLNFRLQQLQALRQAILRYQTEVIAAVKQDLGRSDYEGYFELAAITEIDEALKHLKRWAKPQRVALPLSQKPGSAWRQPEPLGVALIIGAWNYPFQLMIQPLVGAIAAGNCAILKPSELAPATSAVLTKLITKTFDPAYVCAIEGDASTSQELLAQRFDYIFFTGGTRIGRIVMEAAAKHLTPVTLELGGKSPCIIDRTANLDIATKRIAWGKFLNAGQTCIAPDYVLVDRQIKDQVIAKLQHWIKEFYGETPATSPDFARLINAKQVDRILGLIPNSGRIVCGGVGDRDNRYIAPTILDDVTWDAPIMQEEIFGPVLPILTYDRLETAIEQINDRPKPLALYLFSENRQTQTQVLAQTSSGGACINETILHVGCPGLPFGGVGESGIGAYHGKASFDTFSHYKSVLKHPTWLDLDWRYAPYSKKVSLLKKVIGF